MRGKPYSDQRLPICGGDLALTLIFILSAVRLNGEAPIHDFADRCRMSVGFRPRINDATADECELANFRDHVSKLPILSSRHKAKHKE
jgi:hypothetical protein